NYVVSPHRVISIGSTDAGNAFFFDSWTNRVGRLEQESDSIWTTGPGIGIAFPAVAVIHVQRDSKSRILGLQWREGGTAVTARRRLDNVAIPLSFKNGEVSLGGELLVPRSIGRHPAVVLLHGAGAESRRDFHWIRYYLAGKGIAVLSYDKRGVGESGGNWRTASFEDLAADALAGVRLIRTRPDIDSLRIGVLGWSNGGWVAPLVTAHSEIAFAAVGAAPGTPSGENIAFEVEKDLQDAGLGKTEDNAGVAARQYVTRFVINHPAVTPTSWDSLKSVVASERGASWFSRARIGWVLNVAPPPDSATISLLRGMRQQWTLDPVAGWSSVHVPVFIMLGAYDNAVPAPQSAERLLSAFKRAGNCMATVKLYPGGSHALFRVNSLSQADVLAATHYVRGFPADLTGWLQARTRRLSAC
ncbi:MAG: lysophospholipase, partial [Actinomycetota bacterium]|nr:lysophospholipase [Actinomycetota bacterium]